MAAPVSHWRREPYRLLFPLGLLLAWAGVLHWLLLATGVFEEYRSIFHAMTQIQGFMTCFAMGFLFTFIPRRTGLSPPAGWQLVVAVVAPIGVSVCAWLEQWLLTQVFWLVLVGVVVAFVLRRFLRPAPGRYVPTHFIWVPVSFLVSVVAAVLTGVGMAREDLVWMHEVGRWVILQGLFTGLVLGVGGMLLPMITRGVPPPAAPSPGDADRRAAHLLAAAMYVASFWMEAFVSPRLGFGVRAVVTLAVLVATAHIHLRPVLPGFHRRLVWLAAWMLPLGNAVVAVLPQYRRAGLHIIFIGCFGLMALAVGLHVVLTHGNRQEALGRRPWQAVAMAVLLLIALAQRIMVDVDPEHVYLWLGGAAACFLAATLMWTALVWPALRGEPAGHA